MLLLCHPMLFTKAIDLAISDKNNIDPRNFFIIINRTRPPGLKGKAFLSPIDPGEIKGCLPRIHRRRTGIGSSCSFSKV